MANLEGYAFIRYQEIVSELGEPEDPLERLRFFCSLALEPEDWLYVERFFAEISTQLKRSEKEITSEEENYHE